MIYGPRIIENNSQGKFNSRRKMILHKTFQYKYTGLLLMAIMASLAIYIVPTFYFVNQNYDLIMNMAYQTEPGLVDHLTREIRWLNAFLFISTASVLAFSAYIGIRLTAKIVGPLIGLENHMKKVMYGNFTSAPLKSRENDELKNLIRTYEHMYVTLKNQVESDLAELKKLNIDPNQREAFNTWRNLIVTKEHQLDIQAASNVHVLTSVGAELSRRAS